MPAQIRFPIVERGGFEDVVRAFEKVGLANVDVAGRRQARGREIIGSN